MPIDPRIAMSFQTPQIASPMELAQNAYALKGAMQQNALAEAKMAELQRQQQSQNALRALFAGGKMPEATSIYAIDPAMGAEFEQRRAEIDRARAAAGASEAERAGHNYKTQSAAFSDLLNMLTASTDEPSYQYNLNLARSRGFDVSSAPPAYDAAWVNNAKQAVLSVKERADIEDKAAGRNIERERLDIDRKREQRLAAGVDPASFPNVYQAVSEGRIPISRVNSRTAAIFEGVLAKNPDADLTGMNEEQVRNLAGARTGGVTQQNLEMAGTEARNMIAVARNAAKAANLSNLKAVNQFTRWLGGQTGNPKYAALNTAINSLVNSYARAINPRGVPTVSDKQHAREILDSAMAAGNLEAAFSMMETEIAAAHAAAGVGPGGKKPPAVAPAAAPSGRTVVRTGTVNNRKVVQYSDGSIEYAD